MQTNESLIVYTNGKLQWETLIPQSYGPGKCFDCQAQIPVSVLVQQILCFPHPSVILCLKSNMGLCFKTPFAFDKKVSWDKEWGFLPSFLAFSCL